MDPDEMILMDWLGKNTGSDRITAAMANGIMKGTSGGKAWLEQLRQWSREGVEGATSALNAAERIYGKRK